MNYLVYVLWMAVKIIAGILVFSWIVMTVPLGMWIGIVAGLFLFIVVLNWADGKTWRRRNRFEDHIDKARQEEIEEREERWM